MPTKEVVFKQHEQANFEIKGFGGGLTIAPNGKIGMGTETPLHKLHIEGGNLLLTKTSENPSGALFFGVANMNPPELWEIGYSSTSSGIKGLNFSKKANSDSIFILYRDGEKLVNSILFLGDNDKVGIGTINPQAKLDVIGSLKARNTEILGTFSAAQSARIAGNAFIEGNVGLGTDLPKQRLHIVDGNILISKTSSKAGGSPNGSIFFGADINDNFPNGKWGIEYLNNESDYGYGLNFWRPWNPGGGGYFNFGLFLADDGNVGIGKNDPQAKLDVNGSIKAQSANINGKLKAKEVSITLSGWPDFVFENDYPLMSLQETEDFIKQNKHLPNVPSAAEVEENGINIGEINAILIQKVEELTLYILDLQKQINELKLKK